MWKDQEEEEEEEGKGKAVSVSIPSHSSNSRRTEVLFCSVLLCYDVLHWRKREARREGDQNH